MKKNPLLLLLLAFAFVVSSCNKDDDPAPPPVVGRWNADRIVISGLSGAFQVYNNSYEPSFLGTSSTLTLTADKKFTYRNSNGATISQGNGSWEYTGTSLTLNYDDGDSETLTFDATKSPQELYSESQQVTFSLPNPQTNVDEDVAGRIQLFYAKQP